MRAWVLLACLLAPSAAAAQNPLVVWVDAGHGGRMGGANALNGENEKTITLQIARRLRDEITKRLGAKVLLTRDADEDVELSERIRRANAAHADLFVSIHCNALPEGPGRSLTKGIETYFLSAEATGEQARRVAARENAEARKTRAIGDPLAEILNDLAQTEAHHDASTLAYAVHQWLVQGLRTFDRGVHQAPFIVLMGAEMPAILVEVGFVTHPAESLKLTEKAYQGRIAQALVDGIAAYLDETGRRRKASGTGDKAIKPADAGGDPR